MTKGQEIILYTVLVLAILILIVTIIFYIKNLQFFKRFAGKKFKVNVQIKLNPKTFEERAELNVYNGNFIDERLHGLGILYKDKNIDYLISYLEKNNFNNDAKPIVLAHDFVKIDISLEDLKNIIVSYNVDYYSVAKIKAYAINSQGLMTKTKVNPLRVAIKKILDKEFDEDVYRKKIARQKVKREAIEKNKQKRDLRKIKQKENMKRFIKKTQNVLSKIKRFFQKAFLKIKNRLNRNKNNLKEEVIKNENSGD